MYIQASWFKFSNGKTRRYHRAQKTTNPNESVFFYCAVDIVFMTIWTYIDGAVEFQKDTIMAVVYRLYSNWQFMAVSQNYGRERSVAELEKLRREVCEFKHKVVTFFWLVRNFIVFALMFCKFCSSDMGYIKD